MTKTEIKPVILDVPDLQKALGLKGFFGKCAARVAYNVLELGKINRIYSQYNNTFGPDFSENILKAVGVSYDIPEEQLRYIPAEGGFITVSNHHYGSIDGMILSAVIGSRRADYKILTTFLLTLLPTLKDSFIPVDNFSAGGVRSITGIRAALEHLEGNHPLGLFPAGEVATWHGKGHTVTDIPWAENIIKMVKKSGMPVIPIYFEGQNSTLFHLLGKIHPRLRTIRLVHEMLNKKGRCVKVRIGKPIQPSDFAEMDVQTLGRYLRNRCYALEVQCSQFECENAQNTAEAIAEPVPAEQLRSEIAASKDKMLCEVGDYMVYLFRESEAPSLMKEVARLREETFRAVGEGTGHSDDTDKYDSYYHQMLLWNVPNGEIVGAYRLGFGKEIVNEHGGVDGFYTASLFRYQDGAEPVLSLAMELGRSFIVKKYQREIHPLRRLFTGLTLSTLKCPELQYYAGPVSISNDMPDFYKSLAVHYLCRDFSLPEAKKVAVPTHGFVPDFLSVDPDALLQIPRNSVDMLDRLIADLSDGKYHLPVLFRKYFSFGSKLVCFNVDPDFSDSLDGLIVLRFSDVPHQTLRSILRGLPEDLQDKVWEHFYGVPRGEA